MATPQVDAPVPTTVDEPAPAAVRSGGVSRWLPAGTALALLYAALLASHTAPLDLAKYTFYAGWAVLLPGTLVYRALRRTPHTLVEDLGLGAVTGLVLELAAWAVFTGLGIQSAAVVWPLAVIGPFALVPRLRRHWRPRSWAATPSLGWSWAVAGTVTFTTVYVYRVFLAVNPVLPDPAAGEHNRQFIDLSYLLSLAGNAKHHVPLTLPQVAGEPLAYHWFTFAHMAMSSSIGHIDLPVVEMRLMVPAFTALTMIVTAVVAWRLSGRPWAGPVAGLLFFAIGEFNAVGGPGSYPFGSPETSVMVWASLSFTYCQPLLLALAVAIGDGLTGAGSPQPGQRSVPAYGRGGRYALVALFALASSAAKATSLPVTLGGLALVGLVLLVRNRRVPWDVVILGAIVAAAQLLATAVIFDFQSYGLAVRPFANLDFYWSNPHQLRSTAGQAVVAAGVCLAFLLNTQLRVAGMLPLLTRRRLRLEPVQWLLVGSAVAGPAAYVALNGWNASYFTHAGLAFGVIASAWGYCEAFERAAYSPRAKALLATASVAGVVALTVLLDLGAHRWQVVTADLLAGGQKPRSYSALLPMLGLAASLALLALAGGLLWRLASRRFACLRGRGGVVLLTGALLAGSPTLLLDLAHPTDGLSSFGAYPLPASRVDTARWIRDHSSPDDVLATNSHCVTRDDFARPDEPCATMESFWLSGYSERSVLVEGWAFAPRVQGGSPDPAFWDPALLALNDQAVTAPTASLLQQLHTRYHVRFVVVDRRIGHESAALGRLAARVYDNGRMAVYRIG
ncbi:hypothetical protein DN069_15725 [Streptacidiphilus pinicola]|uniref:Uncharacterized protein n=1 Tax=Streptacidiphilus pinicola TaxID=2219663 RepID=A0A2X0J322_9ACTN|nr:hypothetical protein [Streptacidiphilus pinicola]RAG84626.1 hypothetical protein DN069_15725 [Streptacidiphilus pinicola]